jgi:hypothetical protein
MVASIDDILSQVRSKGVLKPCDFLVNVILPPGVASVGSASALTALSAVFPSIAPIAQQAATPLSPASIPLVGSLVNYFVSAGIQAADGSNLTLACESTDIPGKHFAAVDTRTYGPTFKTPHYAGFDDVSMVFRLSGDMIERKLFESWMNLIQDPTTNDFNFYKEYASTVEIIQLDKTGNEVYGVRLIDAYPISILPIPVDWNTVDTYQKQSIGFAYRKWEPFFLNAPITSVLGVIPNLLQGQVSKFFTNLSN